MKTEGSKREQEEELKLGKWVGSLMCYAKELKFYPKKDEEHSKSFRHGSEVGRMHRSTQDGLEGARLEAGRLGRKSVWSSRGDVKSRAVGVQMEMRGHV